MTPSRPVSRPWAFLVTFACYGSRLHGNERGSIDRAHNQPGARMIPAQPRWERYEHRIMIEEPFTLDQSARQVVLAALQDTCRQAGWQLHAAYVRTNHVHAVIAADASRERLLAQLKGRASRDLGKTHPGRRRKWSRHGSVRELWTAHSVSEAVDYVVRGQGKPLEVWEDPDRWAGVRLPAQER